MKRINVHQLTSICTRLIRQSDVITNKIAIPIAKMQAKIVIKFCQHRTDSVSNLYRDFLYTFTDSLVFAHFTTSS